ncbi:MAG: hypothetical protein ACNI28_09705 [Arcobacter sp.]|uniref:hypothetical protein n=1 Tax=Arcobacter sp. TaxID=1872629 RepID=UPI003AFFC4E1
MAYFLASIISVVAATIILLTRYEADDSEIMSELEHMKVMLSSVDSFVNTYINSGASLTDINFKVLGDNAILLNNMTVTEDAGGDTFKSTVTFPNNSIKWQIIPNPSDGSSYKLLIDMRGNTSLMNRAIFSESFVGREYCQKNLFGDFANTLNSYDATAKDFVNSGGTTSDGLFVCTVYK